MSSLKVIISLCACYPVSNTREWVLEMKSKWNMERENKNVVREFDPSVTFIVFWKQLNRFNLAVPRMIFNQMFNSNTLYLSFCVIYCYHTGRVIVLINQNEYLHSYQLFWPIAIAIAAIKSKLCFEKVTFWFSATMNAGNGRKKEIRVRAPTAEITMIERDSNLHSQCTRFGHSGHFWDARLLANGYRRERELFSFSLKLFFFSSFQIISRIILSFVFVRLHLLFRVFFSFQCLG